MLKIHGDTHQSLALPIKCSEKNPYTKWHNYDEFSVFMGSATEYSVPTVCPFILGVLAIYAIYSQLVFMSAGRTRVSVAVAKLDNSNASN